MHPTTLIIALLTLSAGALAQPTNTTDPTLEKRANWGWIGTYAPSDTACKGGWDVAPGQRFELKYDCYPYVPATNNVGINWGTWPLAIDALNVYKDGNCQEMVRSFTAGDVMGGHGPNLCVTVAANSGPWGSVKYNTSDSF